MLGPHENGTRRCRLIFCRAKQASGPYTTGASSYLINSNPRHQDQAVPAFTFKRQACSNGSV